MSSCVIIPAHNEESTIVDVIKSCIDHADDIIVVDSCCSDLTAKLARSQGVRVVTENRPGKHYALRKGIVSTGADEIVFIDADLIEPSHRTVERLLGALRHDDEVSISKAAYINYIDSGVDTGRLTEICARPLLALAFADISTMKSPLAGEFAVKREFITDMRFSPGFSVDLGFLIHCSRKGRIMEVDMGFKKHKHRTIAELSRAAVEVAATVLQYKGWSIEELNYTQYGLDGSYTSGIDLNFLPSIDSEFE